MSTSFTWMCRVCSARAENLDLKTLLAIDGAHECTVADLIRKAARLVRDVEHPLDAVLEQVAVWLDAMADQAKDMTGPADFSVTGEPGSVKYALAVAHALPDEEEL